MERLWAGGHPGDNPHSSPSQAPGLLAFCSDRGSFGQGWVRSAGILRNGDGSRGTIVRRDARLLFRGQAVPSLRPTHPSSLPWRDTLYPRQGALRIGSPFGAPLRHLLGTCVALFSWTFSPEPTRTPATSRELRNRPSSDVCVRIALHRAGGHWSLCAEG